MILTQDKETGKWKPSPKSEEQYDTRDQARNAWIDKKMNEVRNSLQKIRSKR